MKPSCVTSRRQAGLLAAVFGRAARVAAPQFYNWYLDFTFGPLTGQEFRGTISVDGNACPGGGASGISPLPHPPLPIRCFR